MDKMPSPWSIEFRETNTIAKVEPDEIQHRGNRNSGRYRRGSKNNPSSTSSGRTTREKLKRDERFTRGIPRDSSIDGPRPLKPNEKTPAAFFPYAYPKKWSGSQILKHQIEMQEKEYQRRQKVHAEFMKKHNIPIEDALGPASKKEIRDAEKELGVTFSDEYKSILSYHGILSIRSGSSHDMIGIVPGKPESNYNTTKATKFERDNDLKAPKDAYVVENTGYDGLMIWQKTDGTVHQRYPNEPLEKVAGSLTEWLNT